MRGLHTQRQRGGRTRERTPQRPEQPRSHDRNRGAATKNLFAGETLPFMRHQWQSLATMDCHLATQASTGCNDDGNALVLITFVCGGKVCRPCDIKGHTCPRRTTRVDALCAFLQAVPAPSLEEEQKARNCFVASARFPIPDFYLQTSCSCLLPVRFLIVGRGAAPGLDPWNNSCGTGPGREFQVPITEAMLHTKSTFLGFALHHYQEFH